MLATQLETCKTDYTTVAMVKGQPENQEEEFVPVWAEEGVDQMGEEIQVSPESECEAAGFEEEEWWTLLGCCEGSRTVGWRTRRENRDPEEENPEIWGGNLEALSKGQGTEREKERCGRWGNINCVTILTGLYSNIGAIKILVISYHSPFQVWMAF